MRPVGITLSITAIALLGIPWSQAVAGTQAQVVLQDGTIEPVRITAAKDDSLRISVVNHGTKTHNFVIPDFYIFTSNLSPGEHTYVQFKPDKSGLFPYYSDKNGVPEAGMRGTLKVNP